MKKRLSSIAICLLSISSIFNPSIAEKNIEKVVTDDKQSYSVNCVTGAYKYLLDDSGFKKDKWYSKAELVNILNYAILQFMYEFMIVLKQQEKHENLDISNF